MQKKKKPTNNYTKNSKTTFKRLYITPKFYSKPFYGDKKK